MIYTQKYLRAVRAEACLGVKHCHETSKDLVFMQMALIKGGREQRKYVRHVKWLLNEMVCEVFHEASTGLSVLAREPG